MSFHWFINISVKENRNNNETYTYKTDDISGTHDKQRRLGEFNTHIFEGKRSSGKEGLT